MSPGAKWMPFTAQETIEATQSGFCWDARFGGGRWGSYVVTDAYSGGHGRLTVKLGGKVPVKKLAGVDIDIGEIQRYLSEIMMCPSILVNHPSLEFMAVGDGALRVWDGSGPAGATVDIEMGTDGCPAACRADRPRAVGKQSILTPWSGACLEYQEWEGLRLARRFEVSWIFPEGIFTYLRGEVTSCTARR